MPKLWPFRGYYGWAIVGTSFFISIAQVPMYGPFFGVFVNPIGEDTGWSKTTITIAFTFGSLGGSLASAMIGSLLDRYGARGVLVLTGMLVSGALFGVAAMTEPWHFWIAYGIGRTAAVAGVGLGTSVAVANWFIRKRGRAMAIRAAGQRGGQSVMPMVILPVLVLLGWRQSFLLLAVIALLFIAVPAWLFMRRRPEDFGLLPDGESDVLHPRAVPSGEEGETTSPRRVAVVAEAEHSLTLAQVRKTRTLWMLTIGMSVAIAAQIAVNVHVIANFEERGISNTLSVTVATIFTGVAALSMMGWGMLLERVHVRTVAVACMAMYVVAMLVLLVADSYPMAVVFAVIFGFSTGGWTVSQMLMVANYFGRRHAGSIKGFISPFEGFIGITGPLVAAIIRDSTGTYDAAFIAAAAAFGAGLIAFLLAKPVDRAVLAGETRE